MDHERICTSIVERSNLSLRMGIRSLTRLTNAFSKKWENHWAAVALWLVQLRARSQILARDSGNGSEDLGSRVECAGIVGSCVGKLLCYLLFR